MENLSTHARPPTPTRNQSHDNYRRRSLSPSALMLKHHHHHQQQQQPLESKGRTIPKSPCRRVSSGGVPSPQQQQQQQQQQQYQRPPIAHSSPVAAAHQRHRSSPLGNRSLNELNASPANAATPESLGRRYFANPHSPVGRISTASPSSTSLSSACSSPSSPFMELIYSASASTTETPEIFRSSEVELSDSNINDTPIIRNGAERSDSSTLQSMIHEARPPAHHQQQQQQQQQQQDPKRPTQHWQVPRILTSSSSSSASLFSLPSMLGPSPTMSEAVSALESPQFFEDDHEIVDDSHGNYASFYNKNEHQKDDIDNEVASDIQSQSQATTINSLQDRRQNTPKHHSLIQSKAPGPLQRCNAQDEEDDNDDDDDSIIEDNIYLSTNEQENQSFDDAHDMSVSDTEDSQILHPAEAARLATTPTLSALASGSGFCVSRMEILAAAYPEDSASEPATPQRFFRQSMPTPTASQRYPPSALSVTSKDTDTCTGIENDMFATPGNDVETGTRTPPTPTDTEASEEPEQKNTRWTWTFMCRFCIIVTLVLCIVVPLLVVLLYSEETRRPSSIIGDESTNMPVSFPSSGETTAMPSAGSHLQSPTSSPSIRIPTSNVQPTREPLPTTNPTSNNSLPMATGAPSAIIPTGTGNPTSLFAESPTISPTTSMPVQSPTTTPTSNPTLGLVSTAPTGTPSGMPTSAPVVGAPSLPPFTAIWNENRWMTNEALNRTWSSNSVENLQITVVNAYSDREDVAILQDVVEEWQQGSNAISLNVVEPANEFPVMTSLEDCTPILDQIRICPGNFGETASRFFSRVYVNELSILAVTLFQNHDFGLEALLTPDILRYNLCHELGHALGIGHASRGCMLERIEIETIGQASFLRPDVSSLTQLNGLYDNTDA